MKSENLPPHPMIEVIDLTKRFRASIILQGVSLRVEKGETLAVLGPSGVGKTTLLKCINYLTSFEEGSIRLDGKEIIRAANGNATCLEEPAAIRRRVGMVFQEWNLWPNMTVRQNVSEGPRVVLGEPREQVRSLTEDICARVGLLDKLDTYPHELSGGQKQRAAIARALAMRPRVLMLDEVTSALDPPLVAELLDVILSLRAEVSTLVVVTHHVEFAKAVADHIAFLWEGRLHEYGPAREILSSPRTPELQRFLGTLARAY